MNASFMFHSFDRPTLNMKRQCAELSLSLFTDAGAECKGLPNEFNNNKKKELRLSVKAVTEIMKLCVNSERISRKGLAECNIRSNNSAGITQGFGQKSVHF